MYENRCNVISKFDDAYKVVSVARPCSPTGQLHYPAPDAEPQKLLRHTCLKAFRHWVVYLRASARCLHQEVRIVCPLCRGEFSDIEVFLHHIWQNGWYHCPFHDCPERAFLNQTETKLDSQLRQGGKESNMKSAVSFFKNFGRKQLWNCCRSEMEKPSLLCSTNATAELENHSKTELPGADSKSADCSKLRFLIGKVGEMEDTSCNKARDIDASPALTPSSPKACEIDGIEVPPKKRRGSLVGEVHQSDQISLPGRPGCDVILELLPPSRALESHKLPSSITTDSGASLSKSDVDKTINTTAAKRASKFEYITAIRPSSEDLEPEKLRHTISDPGPDPFHTGYGLNSLGQAWTLRTPEELVEETQKQARSLNNAWAKKLTSMSQFRHLRPRLYRTSVFESGLESLHMCLEGHIPSSFEGIFSMMHIVLSFAYILYSHESMTFPLDALYEDIFKWRHAITNEDDSILYCKVADAIWPSVTSMTTMALHKCLDTGKSSSSGSDTQKNKKRFAVYLGDVPFCGCQTEPLSSVAHQKTHLEDLLSKGNVMKLCTRYLNEFGNSNINERCPITPLRDILFDQDPLQKMKTDIIDPLLGEKALVSFHGDLNEVDSMVSRGLLTNPREVEARLISNGRLHETAWEAYEGYVEVVMRACDNAMSPDTKWRAQSYEACLNQIHAIMFESERQKRRGVHIVNQMQPCGTKNLPIESRTAFAPYSFKAEFEAGFKKPEYDPPDQISPSSGTTSQDASSDNSAQLASTETSPMSIVAQDLFETSPKLECPECKETFHGDSRLSNLRRHMRTMHGTIALLDCPVSGCKKKRKRSDNMHKHLRVDHGIEAPRRKSPPPARTGKQRGRRTRVD